MCKRIFLISSLLWALFYTNVLAGDIPESLMRGEQQAVFIGEIISLEEDSTSIKPLTIMMGEILTETVVVNPISKYYGTSKKPKVGDFVVVVLIEDNKIDDSWIFKATTDNYEVLKLVSDGHNIVKRYEEYINTGAYFEAQKKLDMKNSINSERNNDEVKLNEDNHLNVGQVQQALDINAKDKTIDSNVSKVINVLVGMIGGVVIYKLLKKGR